MQCTNVRSVILTVVCIECCKKRKRATFPHTDKAKEAATGFLPTLPFVGHCVPAASVTGPQPARLSTVQGPANSGPGVRSRGPHPCTAQRTPNDDESADEDQRSASGASVSVHAAPCRSANGGQSSAAPPVMVGSLPQWSELLQRHVALGALRQQLDAHGAAVPLLPAHQYQSRRWSTCKRKTKYTSTEIL